MKDIKITNADCLEIINGIPDKSVDFIYCATPFSYSGNKLDKTIPNPFKEQYNRIKKTK